jgi:TolB-like protein/tetratricopeptide (TPR) repeat protein
MSDRAVEHAIECLADGTPVDWNTLEHQAASDAERRRLDCLRVVSRIAAFHQASADTPPGSDSSSPKRWGRYRLLEKVGEGGFATVHRAWDPELEREIAVKILHRRMTDTKLTDRVLREGRTLARVRHPNVVHVLGVESHDDQVALCMEFVHGRTLDEVMAQQGPLSAGEAAWIGAEICRALAAVHAEGLVHRDVKARNVIRETGGRIVLMDFGATAGAAWPMDIAARPAGTPLYLAPELFDNPSATRAADIYSLGVLLHYLVSGTFPVTGASIQELRHAHAQGQRARLRDIRPDLPLPFIHAVDEALAARPDDRPSAGGLESLLAEIAKPGQPPAAAAADKRRNTVAVLPFVDASPEGTLEYFCDGIAEELSHALTAVAGLRVVAPGSSSRFRGRPEDIRRVGAALNAGAVLEGSVRAVGNSLRIVARLVDAVDGLQLWSSRFDRRLDDVFVVQDDIARAVVDALRSYGGDSAGASAPAAGSSGTRDFEAFTLYLKGRHHWNKRTEASLHRSVAYFESALNRDPAYADAYAGLAEARATLGLYGAIAPQAAMPAARSAAQKALELNPSASSALATLGCVAGIFDWNWTEAEQYYVRAAALSSVDCGAHHWYAINHLVPLRRFEEAEAALRQAGERDPLSVPIRVSAGLLSYFGHRFDEARQRLIDSFEFVAHSGMAHLFLGLTLAELGHFEGALRALTKAAEVTARSPETAAALAYLHARAGRTQLAREGLDELLEVSGRRYVSPSLMAQVHAALGDADAALEHLHRACDLRAADLAWLGVRPVFDSLRSDSRFLALLDRITPVSCL